MNFNGQRTRVPADLQRVEELRSSFAEFLRQAGAEAEDILRWELVLTEAVVNAIVHGSKEESRREIEVTWSTEDAQVRLEVADTGPGMQISSVGAKLPTDPLQTSGRGLYLIQQSCDRVEHWHAPEGFRLIMWRTTAGLRKPSDDSEKVLQSALVEISQCYESLAAFYRLGDALIAAERLPDFFSQVLGDIAKVVPHDMLGLNFLPNLHAELRAGLTQMMPACENCSASNVVEQVLRDGREIVWQNAGEISGDSVWGSFACGICVPLRAGGITYGTLTLARTRQPYLVAAELSTVRTYADLFGIALANANNSLAREHEHQALRELEIAATTQAELLPLPVIPQKANWHAVVHRRSARTVAGDYVDICPTHDGGLILAMVDVMGKGISAALFAGMVRTALRIHIEIGWPIGRLMQDLNNVLCRQIGELTMFATCALAYVNPARDRVQIINAGHCPVLWLAAKAGGHSREFGPSAPPLGLYPDIRYAIEEQPLEPGDRLVMVTDGLYEWEGKGDEAGSWVRLADHIRAHHMEGGEVLWNNIQSRIRAALPGESEARDDQTMLFWERRA